MSDAKLTADIVIRFNEEMLKKFNKILKKTEKSLGVITKATNVTSNASKKATQSTKKHTKQLKENNKEAKKRASQATRTAASMGKLTATIAKVRVALGLVKFAAGLAIKAIAIPAGVVAGWSGFLIGLSRGEREFNRTAKSVQVGTGFLKAFSMATKDAGLSADNAVDMLEEMSNKIGDGLETPTHGTAMAFRELGLNLKEVQKMSRQKGLTTIMDSIVKFRKAGGSDQQTVRLADEIFGGEGNKFAGFLLESGELFSDLIDRNKEYNLVSNETSKIWADLGESSEKTGGMFSGLLKEGLSESAADLEGLMRGLQVFMKDNKDELLETVKSVGDTFSGITAQILEFGAKHKDTILFGLDVTLETLKNMATLAIEVAETVMKITDALSGEDVGQGHDTEGHKAIRNARRSRKDRNAKAQTESSALADFFGWEAPTTKGRTRSSRGSSRGSAQETPRGDISITVVSPDPMQAGSMVQQALIEMPETQ